MHTRLYYFCSKRVTRPYRSIHTDITEVGQEHIRKDNYHDINIQKSVRTLANADA